MFNHYTDQDMDPIENEYDNIRVINSPPAVLQITSFGGNNRQSGILGGIRSGMRQFEGPRIDEFKSNSFDDEFKIIDDDLGRQNVGNFNQTPLNIREQCEGIYNKIPNFPENLNILSIDEYDDAAGLLDIKRDIDPYQNYDQRREELVVKQEVKEKLDDNIKVQPIMSRISQLEPKQEEIKIEEQDKNQTIILMQKELLHIYNYICQYNGEIMCFLCEKLIQHDQIKVFCGVCSESECFKINNPTENDRFIKENTQDLPVYYPDNENYYNSTKIKFSNDESKPIKRYKSSK